MFTEPPRYPVEGIHFSGLGPERLILLLGNLLLPAVAPASPGNRHRHLSRSLAARRSAAVGRRRRRPRSSTEPSRPWRIQLTAAAQAIIVAVVMLIAGPSLMRMYRTCI
jgi:hypothetical protein